MAPASTPIFNPVALEDFRTLVKARSPVGRIEGRLFEFTYNELPDPSRDTVYFKPVDNGFAPCGYVNIKKLMEDDI